jgi:hypothetical protein
MHQEDLRIRCETDRTDRCTDPVDAICLASCNSIVMEPSR